MRRPVMHSAHKDIYIVVDFFGPNVFVLHSQFFDILLYCDLKIFKYFIVVHPKFVMSLK